MRNLKTKRPNWLRQKWMITQYFWRWLWISRAERVKLKATRKLVFNLMNNAPMDKILAGEGCSWSLTPGQEKGVNEGLQQYVKVVTGEDIQMAERTVSTTKETDDVSTPAQDPPSNGG